MTPNSSNRDPENPGPKAAMQMMWKRKIPYIAQFNSTPESIALTGVGAWECASGSQVCIGAKPTFVP